MNKKVLTAAIIGLLFGLGSLVVGCRHCRGLSPEERVDWITDRIVSELDLTDSQEKRLEEIKKEVLEKMEEHRPSRGEMHKEVIALVENDQVSEENLNRLWAKKEAHFKEMKPFIVEKIVEFYNILTPEQKNSLAEKMKKFHARCKR